MLFEPVYFMAKQAKNQEGRAVLKKTGSKAEKDSRLCGTEDRV